MDILQKRLPLGFRTEIQSSLKLAIPSILTQFAEMAIEFIDLVMMGWLGSEVLAAGGLGVIILYIFIDVSTGLFEGLGAIASDAFAREDSEQLRKLTIQGLWIGLFVSVPIMLILWHLGSLLLLFGQEENIAYLAEIYLRAIVWGLPAILGSIVFKEIVTACERPQFFTLVTISALLLNGFMNYALMFGHFGFSPLGLTGAGWASVIVLWLSFIIVAGYLQFHPDFQNYQLFSQLWYDDLPTLFKILKLGIPAGIQFGIEIGFLTIIALFMGYLGTANLAAHEITLSIFELATIVPFGFSYATTIRVGQRWSSHNSQEIGNILLIDLLLNTLFSCLVALIIWLFSTEIIGIYLDTSSPDNTEVFKIATSLLSIVAIAQGCYGLHAIVLSALQGLQDTLIPLLMSIGVYLGIGVGSGCFMIILLDWGAISIWLSLTFALTGSTIILIWRFFHIISQSRERC